ncbi:ABC transporter permease [Alteribacillus sp. JSM 102045]|uniref:ABC transporter permease n=1 Tax=Alteribacillus sp. JSM 102045 TaxID=1562101 RepID=UPI0035C162BA
MKLSLVRMAKKILLAGFLFGLLAPPAVLFLSSFAYMWRWPQLFPESFSLRAWQVVFQDPNIWSACFLSMMIGQGVVILNIVLGLPAGKALAHYDFKGKSFIETFLLLPILIPTLAVGMGILLTVIQFGLADTWIGVMLIHLVPTLPYTIRILRAGYENIGTKYEDAARSLGASAWAVFRTVTFPLLFPSLRAVIVLTFVISLSQYVLTALIGGGRVVTLAMVYYPYLSSVDRPVIAALSVLFILIPILILVILEICMAMRKRKRERQRKNDATYMASV